MHKALVILAYALGLLASLAAIVAFPAGIFLLAQVERTLHAESYRPATFTVAWVAYRPSGHKTSSDYWAMGTIDGRRERYGLGDVVTHVRGWEDLESQVHPGQELKVLYDPSFAKEGDAGRLRVIPYEADFASHQKGRLTRTAALVYGPSLVLLAVSVAVGVSIRRPPVATTAMTLFFLVAGTGGLVLIRSVSTLSRAGGGALSSGLLPLLAPALGALSCPGMVAGTAGLVWFVVRQRKKRAETLRAQAPALGFEYLGNAADAEAAVAEMGPFAFLGRGVSRYVENRLRGSRGGYDLLLFDYGYTPSSDDTSTWCTVVRVASPSLRLPDFTLAPKTLLEDLGEAFGVIHPVEFEGHPRFAQDYVLRGPDPDAIRGAVGEGALVHLAAHRNWNMESRGGRLIVYRQNDKIAPDRLEAFLGEVLQLVRALDGTS